MAVVSMTKFKTLTYFKFKVFSLLTILFLGFFLAGCGGGGEGSPNNPISSVTYSISFYDENLDFITTRQIEEGTDISSVEPYSTAWFKANETSPLPTNYNLNESVTIYAIPNVQEITTQEELVAISANVITLRHKYILLNDITLAEGKSGFDSISGWTPIGDYTNRFKGIFNGNGYKITNIWINKPNVNNIGLFGYIEYGQIKNIGVETAKGKGIKGNSLVGGITGYINRGNISNSYTVGNISGSSDYVGGIAGHINRSSIYNSYTVGNISGSSDYVGGIAGYIDRSSIYNSYTVGNISGSSDYVGGIAGYIEYGGNIANSYSIGYISGNSNVGGIAGYIDYGKNISNSYSIANISGYGYYVGGIAGYSVVGTIQNNVAINPFITGKLYVNRVIGTTRSGSSSINNFASIGAVGGADYNGKTNSFSNNNNAQYHGIDKTVDLLKKKNTYLSGSLDWKFDGYNDNEPWVWGAFSDYPYPTFYWQVQKP